MLISSIVPDLELQTTLLGEAPTPKKSKKRGQDEALVEWELPVVGKIKIAKYWMERDGEEDEEDESRRRVPISRQQHIAVIAGTLLNFALAGFFGSKAGGSVFIAGTASSRMNLTRAYFNSAKENPEIRYCARVIALIGLVATLTLQYGLSEEKKSQLIFKVLNAVPWSYPALGILRCEVSELKLHTKLIELAERFNITLSETTAGALSALLQMAPTFGLAVANINPTLTAAGSVLFKMSLRNFTFMIGRKAAEKEDPTQRQIAGAAISAVATAAIIAGYVGSSLQWFSTTLGSALNTLLVVGPSDIGQRTIRQSIRLANEDAREAKHQAKVAQLSSGELQEAPSFFQRVMKKVKGLGKGILYSLPVVSTALAVGQLNNDPINAPTASVAAPLCSDAVGIVRMATRRQFATWALVLAGSLGVSLGASAYTLKVLLESDIEWPALGPTIALSAMSTSFLTNQLTNLARRERVDEIEKKMYRKELRATARASQT